MRINQQKVEYAVVVLEKLRDTSYPTGFPNEMKGDISSFGAGIIQAGLLPSVLFFSEGDYTQPSKTDKNEDDSTKLRRAKLMKVIFDVLQVTGMSDSKRPLLEYVRKNLGKADALDRITEAALAVKLALRAFKFVDKSPHSKTDKTVAP